MEKEKHRFPQSSQKIEAKILEKKQKSSSLVLSVCGVEICDEKCRKPLNPFLWLPPLSMDRRNMKDHFVGKYVLLVHGFFHQT